MKKFITIMAIAGLGIGTMESCTNSAAKQKQAALEAQVDALQQQIAKKQIIDSMNEVAKTQLALQPVNFATTTSAAPVQEQPKVVYRTRTVTRVVHTPRHRSYARSYNRSYNNNYTGYNNQQPVYNQPVYAAQPVQKRGWSSKAKGAAIGGGAGALAGALISNQKGKGAIIGGLLGAAGGLGLGAILDHNNGR